uniref:DNA-directed RNA polymerase subunit n=1 Tax=Flabellia petiolata TaxID=189428 RepID=A0A386AX25_9CHLO|nr:RNA polymerase b-subunit [Flabellia petiolata]
MCIYKLPGLRLRLATSELIRKWAQRQLPNGKKISGQILNPKTVNYQTLKPEKDGLFCERIFGPVNDSICACGRQPQRGQKFCPRCEVEYISTRVRRYRLGYIQLITAVAHIWFFYSKGRPNYFALFLNLPKKKIECLLYCTKNISRTIFPKEIENLNSLKQNQLIIYNYPLRRIKRTSTLLSYNFKRFWNLKKKAGGYKKKLKRINYFLYKSKNIRCKTFVTSRLRLVGPRMFAHFGPPLPTLAHPGCAKAFTGVRERLLGPRWASAGKGRPNVHKNTNYIPVRKSLWTEGGLRDSALYFGFSIISKMFSWRITSHWFCFIFFLIHSPQKGDFINKFYPGPPGLVNFWPTHSEVGGRLNGAQRSRIFCLTGVQLMRTWLTQLTQYQCNDGRLLEIQIRLDLLQLERWEPLSDKEFFNKIQLYRRLKYLRSFRHRKMNPASMVLSVFPVLPPDLRPILQLNNNQIAVSDFNKLYQTVLFRNKRLSRLTIHQNFHCLNSEALQYAQRLLQESIDSLIENGKVNDNKRPLKSLSDLFKGKKGRFRQNLLGKRVDYSGRSVIVVGPYLKIYECGLPKEIAYELFQPFLLRVLMYKNQAQTIMGAKKLFKQKPKFIWDILTEIVHSHPILLNRAPTLHRLSIQSFQPKLIEGKAILLHPLVCSAFNADFDGDQMGIHIPLCFEARAEAWKITWSQNNLFSVATNAPVCAPSQDIILGSSFLTTRNFDIQKFGFLSLKQKIQSTSLKRILFKKPIFLKNLKAFQKIDARLGAFAHGGQARSEVRDGILSDINIISFSSSNKNILPISLFDKIFTMKIWCSYNPILNGYETEKKIQKLIEIRLNLQGNFQKFRPQFYQQYHRCGAELLRKIRTTYNRLKFYENLQ